MPPPTPDATAATARLIAPRMSLASCVRAYVVRDTTRGPALPPEQRFNHYPASPLCGITWFVHGAATLVDPPPDPPGPALPRVVFGGPRSRPFSSCNPGPVHAFFIVFFPQALHALTGIDMSRHVNALVAVEQVLDAQWLALTQQVLAAPDDDARIALIERFLEPRWQAARSRGDVPASVIGDWVQGLGAHAAATGWGRSARHLERRIKAWAGLPLRTLRRMSRAEQSFLQTRESVLDGSVAWADVAARSGFADQAHLCRQAREITGHSPAELARKAQTDESYWVYRIWA